MLLYFLASCTWIMHVGTCSVSITRRCVLSLFLLVLRRSDKQKKRTSVLLIVKVITVLVFLQHTLLASKGTHTEYDALLVQCRSTDYVVTLKTHHFSIIPPFRREESSWMHCHYARSSYPYCLHCNLKRIVFFTESLLSMSHECTYQIDLISSVLIELLLCFFNTLSQSDSAQPCFALLTSPSLVLPSLFSVLRSNHLAPHLSQ